MKFTILFLFFMLVMCIERIWETLFKKREKEKGQIVKKWTFNAISIVHLAIGIITIIEYFIVKRKINFFVSLIGFSMFTVAFMLRNWSIRSLGRYHSVHIEIRNNHELITYGPYKYLRHPYYCSVIIELLGFPLIANAYFSFCLSLFIYIPLVFIRIYFEEKALIEKLGKEYSEYKKDIWGFVPIKKYSNIK